MQYLLGIMMFLTALFLILLVLVQRGRGGGLAGAFGGAGGQSAFGTKAGDMFTKITIGTAAVWIIIAALSVRLLNAPKVSVLGDGSALPTVISPGPAADDETGDELLGGGLQGLGTEGSTDGEENPATSTEPDSGTTEPPVDGPAVTPPANAPTATPATEPPAEAPAAPPAEPPTTEPAPGE